MHFKYVSSQAMHMTFCRKDPIGSQAYTANSTEHIGRVLNVTTFEHLTRVQKFKKVYLDHLKDISGFEYVHRVQSSKIEF